MSFLFKTEEEKREMAIKLRKKYEYELNDWRGVLVEGRVKEKKDAEKMIKKYTKLLAKLKYKFPEIFEKAKAKKSRGKYSGRKIGEGEDWDSASYANG